MTFPLCLDIGTPPRQVLPVLARAIRLLGKSWRLRIVGEAIVWQPEKSQERVSPLSFHLEPGALSGHSLLAVHLLHDNGSEELAEKVEQVVQALRAQGFVIQSISKQPGRTSPANPAPSTAGTDPARGPFALYVAPDLPPYSHLRRYIEQALERHRFRLHHLAPEKITPGMLRRGVEAAALVIAAWQSEPGRAALLQARAHGRPALALNPKTLTRQEWPGSVVPYGGSQESFLSTLGSTLAQLLEPTEEESKVKEAEEREPVAPQRPLEDERRRIYGQVARDRWAPLEQRFHAARVLAEAGDAVQAAKVLGTIVTARDAGELRQEALEALGSLGPAARPILWHLDAQEPEPHHAVEIARQLARASDVQTALFRLVRLAQHEEEEIRLKALETMAEIGGAAAPRFQALLTEARDPRIRLEAARWLKEHGHASRELRESLFELAALPDQPEVAQRAVELIAEIAGTEASTTLRTIARQSPSVDARLAAAEVLNREGDTTAARAVLLSLAQGTNDLAAGAALDMLINVSDSARDDTERLMNTATLKSVRRRAAEILSQPHQPEPVQQAAARVFLALDRPALARPVLARLSISAQNIEIRRWAAQQLALIGESALEEIRAAFARADDPVVGHYLAEGLLSASRLPDDRRQAAIWLAEHSNLPRAVEILGDLALSARISGSDAVRATDDLNQYAGRWAGAGRALATLATDSPHAAVRARALDLLLREHPSELPLSLLVDLAVTGSIGTADRSPVMQQLSVLARPAASRIAAHLASEDIDTDRRWQLMQLMTELPDSAVMPALIQLSARAPQNRIRYVAAEQLIARGQTKAGYAALATIAIDAPEWVLREQSLYELAQALPETELLFRSIIEHTRYEDSLALAHDLLHVRQQSLVVRTNDVLDRILLFWQSWVASLPLAWLDRLIIRLLGRPPDQSE